MIPHRRSSSSGSCRGGRRIRDAISNLAEIVAMHAQQAALAHQTTLAQHTALAEQVVRTQQAVLAQQTALAEQVVRMQQAALAQQTALAEQVARTQQTVGAQQTALAEQVARMQQTVGAHQEAAQVTSTKNSEDVLIDRFNQSNPPRFFGAPADQDPMDFLGWIQNKAKILRIPSELTAELAGHQLGGVAATWYKLLQDSRDPDAPRLTWEEFACKFRERFFPASLRDRALQTFLNLRMTRAMTVTEYDAGFTRLARVTQFPMTPNERVKRFIQGLPIQYRFSLVSFLTSERYAEVVNAALAVETTVMDVHAREMMKKAKHTGSFSGGVALTHSQQQQQSQGYQPVRVTFSAPTPARPSGFLGYSRMRLPVMKFGGQITYSRSSQDVEKIATKLLKILEEKKREMVQIALGFDIEWRPSFKRGVPPGKVAVMQICYGASHCYVLHLIHSGVPPNLQLLLEDPLILKVGVGIGGDAVKVFRDYKISIKGVVDLSFQANKKLGGSPQQWSLASLAEKLLSKQLKKPSKIRLGNWESPVLSKEQLEYAATDAFASWYLYQAIKDLPEPPESADKKGEVEDVPQQ